VAEDMKNLPFGEAEPGATGLELLLSLALKLGCDSGLPLTTTLARVTSDPVRVLGDALGSLASSAGRLVEGGVADVCLFDPDATWTVTPDQLCSQGKHTPFAFEATGMALPGRVRATLVAGTVAYEAPPAADARALAGAAGAWRVARAGAARAARHAGRAAALSVAGPRRPPCPHALVVGQAAAPAGHRLQVQGHAAAGRQAAGGQPCVVAGHHGRACRVPRGALRLQGRGAALAAGGPAGDGAGTLYIERERKRDALRVVHQMRRRAAAGDTVAVFPEGTTGPATRCCPSTPTCCRPPSPPARRCSRWRCALPTASRPSARRCSSATPRWRRACGAGHAPTAWWPMCTCCRRRAARHADRRALAETLRIDITAALADIDRLHPTA
jgi:hypothetical protein